LPQKVLLHITSLIFIYLHFFIRHHVYDPSYIDGWIVKFFLYTVSRERMNLDRIMRRTYLSIEMPVAQFNMGIAARRQDPDTAESFE
jgi:hypothetical protein